MIDIIQNNFKGLILFNEPMSKHTSYGIGGPAEIFAQPHDKEDLKRILKFANNNKKPVHFIGSGSNLLVSDEGISGMVITLGKSFKNIFFNKRQCVSLTTHSSIFLPLCISKLSVEKLLNLTTFWKLSINLPNFLLLLNGAFPIIIISLFSIFENFSFLKFKKSKSMIITIITPFIIFYR